jgi:ubiquinone/menaquinone biosynthesis C-methylase UbiE
MGAFFIYYIYAYSIQSLKKRIKKIVKSSNSRNWLSEIHFRTQQATHLIKNTFFRIKHPELAIPTDRDLFETFQLDYALYFSDGQLAANELIEWSKPYLLNNALHILDWGSGVGRIIQHIPAILPKAICYGADINQQRISWCRKHIDDVLFDSIEDQQLPYPSELFDLVIGISVFTHIQGNDQAFWLKELHRITKPGAVVVVSTHGSFFEKNMNTAELSTYQLKGWQSNNYQEKGHRLLSTYNKASHFKELAGPYFTVQKHYDGKSHPEKLGGQDIWILINQ